MSNSYVEYTGDNAQTVFSYASILMFDDDFVSDASQLRVYVDRELQTVNVDWTANASTKQVTFAQPPFTNAVIRIQRYTKSDSRYVNFTDSTNVTAKLLNTDSTQNFFLAQEAKDLETDALFVGPDGTWDCDNRVVGNAAIGFRSTDLVTKGELAAAISGVEPANLGAWGYLLYTGTGAQTNFALPSYTMGLSDADYHVFVDGVKKLPTTDYTIDTGTEDIVFTSAPSNGLKIQILWAQGIVGARLLDDTIVTPMLTDRAVTVAKIGSGGATTGHVLKATGGGNAAFGTILSNIVTDFDTQVRTNRLDQLALPTSSLNANGNKVINVSTPTLVNDAVNKSYVDSINTTLNNRITTEVATLNTTITNEDNDLYDYIDNRAIKIQNLDDWTWDNYNGNNQWTVYLHFNQIYKVQQVTMNIYVGPTTANFTLANLFTFTFNINDNRPANWSGNFTGVGNTNTLSVKPIKLIVPDANESQWITGAATGNKFSFYYNRYGTNHNEFAIGFRWITSMPNSSRDYLINNTVHSATGIGELL